MSARVRLNGVGRKTVTTAGTAEAVVATETFVRRVIVSPLPSNTGHVVVGVSGVLAAAASTTGVVLVSSIAAPVAVAVDDLRKLYVDAKTSGEGISYFWEL